MTIRSTFKIATRFAAMLAAGLVLFPAASSAQAGFHGDVPAGIAKIPTGPNKPVTPPRRLPPCPANHIGVCH